MLEDCRKFKNHHILAFNEYPEILAREVKQFLKFYLLILPHDPTHTNRSLTLTPRSHIHRTVVNACPGTFLPGIVFPRTFFPSFFPEVLFSKNFFPEIPVKHLRLQLRTFLDTLRHLLSLFTRFLILAYYWTYNPFIKKKSKKKPPSLPSLWTISEVSLYVYI